jgi:hypothetical protein
MKARRTSELAPIVLLVFEVLICPAMPASEKPRNEELADEGAVWNAYRESRSAKGVDISRVFADCAAEIQLSLRSPGAREDFVELCRAGCFAQTLAALVLALRYRKFEIPILLFLVVWSPVTTHLKAVILKDLYQRKWFDMVKSSRIRPQVFNDLQPPVKLPFDTPTSHTPFCAPWVATFHNIAQGRSKCPRKRF